MINGAIFFLFLNEQSKDINPDHLYLNFASGYRPNILGIPNISTVAKFINPKIFETLSATTSTYQSVILVDFVNASMSKMIIKNNRATIFQKE